jgi:hypothetical protein
MRDIIPFHSDPVKAPRSAAGEKTLGAQVELWMMSIGKGADRVGRSKLGKRDEDPDSVIHGGAALSQPGPSLERLCSIVCSAESPHEQCLQYLLGPSSLFQYALSGSYGLRRLTARGG